VADREQTGFVTVSPHPHPWFDRHEPAVELPYVGMTRQEAESAASANGVIQLRIMDIPSPPNLAVTADIRPQRLNLLVVEGRVVRAAFF
jgi:hypothetical protein